jgi:uncharacterized protein involved in exopolysaccharide biosynthesis
VAAPLPFAIGLTAGVVVYKQMPVRYKSDTLITVVPQRVPKVAVRNAITTRIEDRLPAISDQILSRSRLERIVTSSILKEQRATMPLEDIVQAVRATSWSRSAGIVPRELRQRRGEDSAESHRAARGSVIDENTRDRAKFSTRRTSSCRASSKRLEGAGRAGEEAETYRKTYVSC